VLEEGKRGRAGKFYNVIEDANAHLSIMRGLIGLLLASVMMLVSALILLLIALTYQ